MAFIIFLLIISILFFFIHIIFNILNTFLNTSQNIIEGQTCGCGAMSGGGYGCDGVYQNYY